MSHDVSRRTLLGALAASVAASTVGCGDLGLSAFFRKNFREMSAEEKKARLAEVEAEVEARYGRDVEIGADEALPGVHFAYALDLSRCVGCRRCVYACVEENNQSRDPQVQWIRVQQMDNDRGIDWAHADPYYESETVPQPGHFYVPLACQQCEDPPCVKVCPIGATWRAEDGIVVIDYDWCFGCRCCMAACPYGARRFNWGEPGLPSGDLNPRMHYLGNRPRPKGVVEKCTFCIQRVRQGRYPACVEICPVGARKFGSLLDPGGEIRYILEKKRVFVLKADLDTKPRFFYFYG